MTPPDPETAARARMPADVDAPDKVLYGLTFRQLAILAVAAVVFAAGWHLLHPLVPPAVLVIVAVPLGGVVFAIAVGRRDGLPFDVWLTHAIRYQHAPHALSTTDTTTTPAAVGHPTRRPGAAAGAAAATRRRDRRRRHHHPHQHHHGRRRRSGRDRRRHHRQPHPAHPRRTGRAAGHVRPVAQLTHPPHPDRHRQPTRRPAIRRRHPHHPRHTAAQPGAGGGVRRPRRVPHRARPPPRPAAPASPHHHPQPADPTPTPPAATPSDTARTLSALGVTARTLDGAAATTALAGLRRPLPATATRPPRPTHRHHHRTCGRAAGGARS